MYESLLDSAFRTLPETIRNLHRSPGTYRFGGSCNVRRGNSLLAQLLARVASLPPAGTIDMTFTVESNENHEIWIRRFGAHRMRSVLHARDNRLYESLGLASSYSS